MLADEHEHRYLTHKQLGALAVASKGHELLVLVLGYTGIRWAEATALRFRHIDFTKGRLKVEENAVEVGTTIHEGTPKSGKGRSVPVPSFIMAMLAERAKAAGPDDLVFPGRDSAHMRRVRASSGSRSWFKNALKAAGLPRMTPHDLRHTAASLAVQAGANVKTIQRMLGYTSAAMTLDIYADLFEEDIDAVSLALDQAAFDSDVPNLFPQAV